MTKKKITTDKKSGPWSALEKQYISDQAGKLAPEAIAEKLKRNPKAVKDYMTKSGLMKYYYKKDLEEDQLKNIRKSKYWDILKTQFTEKELESFEYHWHNIVRQFRDDIFHTEEIQIIDAIKLQLMMDRNQTKQKMAHDLIDSFREKIEEEKKKPKPDEKIIDSYHRDLSACFSGIEALDKDHLSLLKEKNNCLQKLKATRESRITQIENSKETLIGWIKALYQDPKLRYELGLKMEKNRIAAKEEYKRLSEYHTYLDGAVDKPILNHETVKNWTNSIQNNTEKEETTDTNEVTQDIILPEDNV